jgi:pimeloyl-ACP methyl ester carboxylesterase
MTTVFVHGVPDTHRVWGPLIAALQPKNAVALSLPGFDAPLPEAFAATKEAYVDWLIGELERLPPPLDIVSHDWGSLIAVRAIFLRPGLVRSWVSGGVPFTPDYSWHPTARIWQMAGAGEKAMARLDATLAARLLEQAGLSPPQASETAAHIDETMKDCILRLYRSGERVFEAWSPGLETISAPGLVIWGEEDVYAAPDFADRAGALTGARVERIPDCGHWWQLQATETSASAIAEFWRTACEAD